MKCYAIAIPNGGYLAEGRYNVFGYRPTRMKGVQDPEEAKHYKTRGIAESVCKSQATKRRNDVEDYKERIEISKQQGVSYGWLKTAIQTAEESADFIDKFTVVEVEVETPSYSKLPPVKFETYGVGFKTKKSMGNCHCKGCGIYFKKIPLLQFGVASKPARICPLCIQERAHEAQKLLDEMPEDLRASYETERFVHRMG